MSWSVRLSFYNENIKKLQQNRFSHTLSCNKKIIKEEGQTMNETMLALLGFATIIVIIALLLKNVTIPSLAFIGVSTVTTAILVLTKTFTISEMGDFISAGVKDVHGTAALFIFSVLFFGIMTDAGMFDKIINALMKKVGNNVIGVTLMTCLIAMIGHLDGGGASTFLITIPAMLPVYKRLKMRPTTLLLICVTAMGVMNLLPWGGPTMRSATVLEIDPNELWMQLIPMQIVGIVLAVATAIIWGIIEKKRGAGLNSTLEVENNGELEEVAEKASNDLARPKLFFFNVILTLMVIICLIFVDVPSYYIFMIGCVIALLVNYPGAKMQNKIIKSHSGPALMMASTILAAGVFLGVLEQSDIMTHMANALAGFIPTSIGRFLPLIVGVLSVPLTLMFCTDSYFYGFLPVLIAIGNNFGVEPAHIAIAMVVCRNCATFISPVVPATFLGVGLAGVEIKDHIKSSFLWIWGVSIICLISGVLLGVLNF
ncbi:MAG: CitMHS family transporter [Lachnospiraceae bacterium]